jgi:hypothetical protein
MFNLLIAHTLEIDDPQAAVAEILDQLDLEHRLLKNSAGLLFCSLDCVASGVVEAVSKALPFEVIGCTTHGIGVPRAMNENMLAVAVFTSDVSSFKLGISDSLDEDWETRIQELYKSLTGSPDFSPSLMLVCHPGPDSFSGDRAAEMLDRVSGGVPLFGTNALDETFGLRTPLVIHNGAAYPDRLALLLIRGGVEGRFYIKSLPIMNIYSQPALVTEAMNGRIISINNIQAAEFMEKIGVISKGKTNAVYAFPLLVDNHDGTGPHSCGITAIEESGVLHCGITIATGATLQITNQVQEYVLYSSEQLAESIVKENGARGHLIFSCFGRSAPLLDLKDEMSLFQKYITETPYMIVYSGGEFCPVDNGQGGIRNGFHQFSIISLSLLDKVCHGQ